MIAMRSEREEPMTWQCHGWIRDADLSGPKQVTGAAVEKLCCGRVTGIEWSD